MIAAARERAGSPVLGELELGLAAARATSSSPSPGTNGKTTTVELIGAIHRAAGVPAVVAGNVGLALSRLGERAAPRRRAARPGDRDRLRGLLVPARGRRRVRAARRRCC